MRSIIVVVALGGVASAEPKMTAGGSATLWIPQGDVEDSADASVGIRPHFAYRVRPFFAIVSSFDFVFVNEEEDVDDITYWTLGAGARFILARPDIEPYGEIVLGYHSLDVGDFDDTNLGFRIGGGATYPLGNLVANASLGYSVVSFDAGFVDIDADAIVFELGLGARF